MLAHLKMKKCLPFTHLSKKNVHQQIFAGPTHSLIMIINDDQVAICPVCWVPWISISSQLSLPRRFRHHHHHQAHLPVLGRLGLGRSSGNPTLHYECGNVKHLTYWAQLGTCTRHFISSTSDDSSFHHQLQAATAVTPMLHNCPPAGERDFHLRTGRQQQHQYEQKTNWTAQKV